MQFSSLKFQSINKKMSKKNLLSAVTERDEYLKENTEELSVFRLAILEVINDHCKNYAEGYWSTSLDENSCQLVNYVFEHTLGKTETAEDELDFLKEQWSKDTFGGRKKGLRNEKEKARLSVRKAIKEAIAKLIANPDTQDIGPKQRQPSRA